MKFVSFDPNLASIEFLTIWLSHYGICTTTVQPRSWYVSNTNVIIKSIKRTTYDTKDNFKFLNNYYELQHISSTLFEEVNNLFNMLTTDQYTAWLRTVKVDNAVETKNIKQKSKPILAYFLGASLLLSPIIYDQKKNLFSLTNTGTLAKTSGRTTRNLMNTLQTESIAVLAPEVMKITAKNIMNHLFPSITNTALPDAVIDDIMTAIMNKTRYTPNKSLEYVSTEIKKSTGNDRLQNAVIDTIIRTITKMHIDSK